MQIFCHLQGSRDRSRIAVGKGKRYTFACRRQFDRRWSTSLFGRLEYERNTSRLRDKIKLINSSVKRPSGHRVPVRRVRYNHRFQNHCDVLLAMPSRKESIWRSHHSDYGSSLWLSMNE